MQLAADVVEKVLATDGEMYLDTREHELTWLQLSLLDVKLFLLFVAALTLSLLVAVVFVMVRLTTWGVRALLQDRFGQKQKSV